MLMFVTRWQEWHRMAQRLHNNEGPDSARVAELMRAALASGNFPLRQYIPTTRALGRQWQVSSETVRRAMKMLEVEGLLAIVPRHGCKAIAKPLRGQPPLFAYVLPQGAPGQEIWAAKHMYGIFQAAAARYGVSLVTIGSGQAADLTAHIRALGAAGVLLNDSTPAVVEAVLATGLPVVATEEWDAAGRFDAVCQDNFGGAMQVADYLAAQGHKRVAWVGHTKGSITAAERWGGTLAGLHGHGIEMPRSLVCESYAEAALQGLLARLRGARPPTAVVALWGNITAAIARLAAGNGLTAGGDFALIGWTTREFRNEYAAAFFRGQPLPAVTWSIATMAEVAIARLLERKAHPDLPKVRINVDTQLLFDEALCVSPREQETSDAGTE